MKFFKSFANAVKGIITALGERNFRFHLCAAVFVIAFAVKFYSFTTAEWAVLLLTCGSVISLELVNTAVEKLCDKVCAEKDSIIRMVKDCSAGAVLVSAVTAAAVGCFLFIRSENFLIMREFFSNPLNLIVLIVSILASWGIVFLPDMLKRK